MLIALSALAALLWACGQAPVLPRSSGRAYEVVLVGDADEVRAALETDAEVLPQREPCFDVRPCTHAQFDARAKLARSVVVVNIDTTLRQTRIGYEKNVYAKPQMVVSISAPSGEVLSRDRPRWAHSLLQLLTRHEMNAAIAQTKDRQNPNAAKAVEEVFGAGLCIPADLQASKRGQDFLWFSNNTVEGVQNICVYSYPLGRDFTAMRDSIMRRNIPGETDGMYVQTVRGSLKEERLNEKDAKGRVVRGLWEMHGDAMGGPFVAHVVADSQHERALVAEAFVYAPEGLKRNKLRRVEAALYTLTLGKEQEQNNK